MPTLITTASVKIMQSYDYSHFEACLGITNEEGLTLQEINEVRKQAQRLTDEAIRQYKKAKGLADSQLSIQRERERLEQEVAILRRQVPGSEWTAQDKAKVKSLADDDYWSQYDYNYDDDNEPYL